MLDLISKDFVLIGVTLEFCQYKALGKTNYVAEAPGTILKKPGVLEDK